MGYRILWHGIPLARCDKIERSHEFAAADLDALPGYTSVRPVIRAAEAALSNYGFAGPVADPASSARGQDAFTAAAALGRELELVREEDGLTIPTEFIALVDCPAASAPLSAWIVWGQSSPQVHARVAPPDNQSGNYSREF